MKFQINSLYLCVRDMDRAVSFYEAFLERPAAVRDGIYSVFDVGGFRLGLFAYEKKGEQHTFGSNCLPSIAVENVKILRKKLTGLSVVFPVTRIAGNWVAEFQDSEGNHVELTAPAG